MKAINLVILTQLSNLAIAQNFTKEKTEIENIVSTMQRKYNQ